MQLLGRLVIRSRKKIVEFLNQEHVGRVCSIDKNGYPQIIPMNFVYLDDTIYMHSHTKGEKIENIKSNDKVGFEVDKELEFLPSYFTHPTDASQADTLYISVVIKGNGTIVLDKNEKTLALNGLMEKYQPEGKYEKLTPDMPVISEVTVIKIVPQTIYGKYKIGQNLDANIRKDLARKIFERNLSSAKETLRIMGFEIIDNTPKQIDDSLW